MHSSESQATSENANQGGEHIDVARALVGSLFGEAGAGKTVDQEQQGDEHFGTAKMGEDLHVSGGY